ncbi:hypothetical protein [Paenarthrobacter nitroguajacolicus]|nr:hypothetical protein [Paenarthrobacter nitroguajacolicus]
MEVSIAIENAAGETGSVSAVKPTYAEALAAACELIPEGCKALNIRTSG